MRSTAQCTRQTCELINPIYSREQSNNNLILTWKAHNSRSQYQSNLFYCGVHCIKHHFWYDTQLRFDYWQQRFSSSTTHFFLRALFRVSISFESLSCVDTFHILFWVSSSRKKACRLKTDKKKKTRKNSAILQHGSCKSLLRKMYRCKVRGKSRENKKKNYPKLNKHCSS